MNNNQKYWSIPEGRSAFDAVVKKMIVNGWERSLQQGLRSSPPSGEVRGGGGGWVEESGFDWDVKSEMILLPKNWM